MWISVYYGIQKGGCLFTGTLTYNLPCTCFCFCKTHTNSGYHTLTPIEFPVHLLFLSCLDGSCDEDCALQRHVFGLIQDSVLWHALSLGHSSQAAASPFDPSREIHLHYLI